MEGSFRQQIVESEGKRLARERRRYARAWWSRQKRWAILANLIASTSVFVAGLVAGLLNPSGMIWCFGSGLAGMLTIAGLRPFADRCPWCRQVFSRHRDGLNQLADTCAHCDVPFGYLPTAADLDDESGPE